MGERAAADLGGGEKAAPQHSVFAALAFLIQTEEDAQVAALVAALKGKEARGDLVPHELLEVVMAQLPQAPRIRLARIVISVPATPRYTA